MKFGLNRSLLLILVAFFAGCARGPIRFEKQAMRLAASPQNVLDDIALVDFDNHLRKNIEHLKTKSYETMQFGPEQISRLDYIAALEKLLLTLEADLTGQLFYNTLKENFDFYEVYGSDNWGEVFITSYYEPVIKGSLKSRKPYTQPIYGLPDDMLTVSLAKFAESNPAFLSIYQSVKDKVIRDGVLRGRIEEKEKTKYVLPYFSRKEIDQDKLLKKSKVLCYVNPVDAFFLQIQGSGRIELTDRRILRLGYAGQNGHPYYAIGKSLFTIIPKEEMTAHKIQAYLRSLPDEEAQRIMNENASYVFFREIDTEPITYFGAEAAPGRTIATDPKFFPKGALAFLQYKEPIFKSADSDQILEFKPTARFVLDQDTGGAIRGPHRVDLFWGRGEVAARVSGVMRNQGRLYYILPKKSVN